MSDSSDDEDANLPPAAECDRRCKEFAEVTGTDTALAMLFLQDRQWSLEVRGFLNPSDSLPQA